MPNSRLMPPEGFRTAAYLEARARLDTGAPVRKTRGANVQCIPPNVKCGGRCIPPTWDCRLKGQGADPHLRAVATDPLGGLANIQRGVGRITKGVTKGNFSEVEGGKRAVIRGVVKATPGNIQQKKELQRKLENRTRSIGVGLAVVTGGLGAHALLMKTDTFGYRNGAGANINNAVRLGVSRVLDATPVLGANRARVRAAVQAGLQGELTRQANPVSAALTNQLARTRVTAADTDARTNLVRGLTAVNDEHRGRGAQADFDAWNRDHQRAFWSATRREDNQEASVFARPATNEFLARQFNLSGDDVLTTRSIKDAVERQITQHKSNLLDLAQQQGFRVKTARGGARYMEGADQRTFIQGVVRGALSGGTAATPLRAQLTRDLEETLRRTPKGRADEIYRGTFRSFNDFYTQQATATNNAYSAPRLTREMRRTGVEQTLLDGRQVRAGYVLGLVRPGSEVRGPAHAELALREYHAREVVRTPRSMYAISDRLATAAASEIEGRPVSRAEAFSVLERAGFTGAVPQSSPATRSFGRRRTYSPEGEAVYQLMRQNPGMTLAAARRAVKRRREGGQPQGPLVDRIENETQEQYAARVQSLAEEQIRRNFSRGDASPELVRTAAYLAARSDRQEGPRLGKPCGASHIPKAHECRKGQQVSREQIAPKQSRAALTNGLKIAAAVGGTAIVTKTATDPNVRLQLRELDARVRKSVSEAHYKVRQEALSRSIDGLSNKQLRLGLNKLPAPYRTQAHNLVGRAKKAAAVMSLELAGYTPIKVDTTNNYVSFTNKHGDIKSVGSVGDNLISYTFHDVRGDVTQILPPGRPTKHVVFQIDRRFDQKSGVSDTDVKAIRTVLTAMFKDSVSNASDGTLLLNSAWDKDGKGSGRSALYKRYGFNNVQGIEGMQWAVVEDGAVKRIPRSEATQAFINILENRRRDTAFVDHFLHEPA